MKKGVFWLIDGDLKCYPFGGRIREGIAKSGNTYNHKKLWEHIRPKGCNKSFDYYPRGRVEISAKGNGVIYMSPHIGNEDVTQICEEFEYIPVGDIIQKYPYFKDYEISCEYEHPEAEPKKEEAEKERTQTEEILQTYKQRAIQNKDKVLSSGT